MVRLTENPSQEQQLTYRIRIFLIKITGEISFLSQSCFNLPLSKETYSLEMKHMY